VPVLGFSDEVVVSCVITQTEMHPAGIVLLDPDVAVVRPCIPPVILLG
jgi:hypothetical protein